jgi:ppGpp synthetase/RelA/SpoT-type nucleotidyltranferase
MHRAKNPAAFADRPGLRCASTGVRFLGPQPTEAADMKFDDYEREHYFRYGEFAETITHILEKAIQASDLPRPQSIQRRAKSPKSLRDRLEEGGKLDSDSIESERRDLAGARLIFYTNTDVDRFLNSRLIFENFEIERDATRIHHPTAENEGRRYRALHYTVKLKPDRAKLPEYARFDGMRCEIQIHTILNHAWSETSHDIAYKNKPREGFGTKAMEEINNRLNRIMDKYLLPAGYEFQRVQHDYERLQQGKELFDSDLLKSLESAADNNERFDLITSLKEHVIPNYDDVPAIFGDLIEPLLSAVTKAKDSPVTPRKTPFGELEGKTAADIARLVVDLLEMLRYLDIERVFGALCQIFVTQEDEQSRTHVKKAVENLAKHELQVWEKAGPYVQTTLADHIERMPPDDREAVRPLIVQAWDSILSSEVTGTTWKADSVILHSGAVPVSPAIIKARDRAIAGLFSLFKTSKTEAERRETLHALWEATRADSRGGHSNELLKLTITDGTRIVKFFADEADGISYELREMIEHHYLYAFHRARQLANNDADPFGCRAAAQGQMEAIGQFRDRINADEQFVRYKMLVGFETVLPEQWEDENRDFQKIEEFRVAEGQRFVDAITPDNEAEWFQFIERCAATKSNDGATFPLFGKFLTTLARRKPDTAKRLLAVASRDLLVFLPAILDGLYESDRPTWRAAIDAYLAARSNLEAMARHWRISKPNDPALIASVLKAAIAAGDDNAVVHCILYAMEHGPGNGVPPNEEFFNPALSYVAKKKLVGWVRWAWFAQKSSPFLDALTTDEVTALLDSLLDIPRIEFQVERILTQVARSHRALVWEFLGKRLRYRDAHKKEKGDDYYDAIPYQLHGLEKELSKDAPLAVSIVRGWYAEESALFRFLGGRLLSVAFPTFDSSVADALGNLVTNGTGEDTEFVLAVMENYHDRPETHDLLKLIVTKYPKDSGKLEGVATSLDGSGVVHGEFGFVESIRKKKAAIEPWQSDPRPEVQAFATEYLRQSDLRLADEQRRADDRKSMRNLRYDNASDDQPEENDTGSDND